jgi:hypothetical protein
MFIMCMLLPRKKLENRCRTNPYPNQDEPDAATASLCTELAGIPSSRLIARIPSPCARRFATAARCLTNVAGRPSFVPRALLARRPAVTRFLIMDRSNSAMAIKMLS